jgi:hypothetical protein
MGDSDTPRTDALRKAVERFTDDQKADAYLVGLMQLERELTAGRADFTALQRDYGLACKLVADMHGAATGRPGEGPRLGVVEDVAAVRAEVEALRAAQQEFVRDYENGDMGDLKHYARAMRAALAKEKP